MAAVRVVGEESQRRCSRGGDVVTERKKKTDLTN